MTEIIMRRALAIGFAGFAAALAAVANAADYPARPLRYIVGFAPGGIGVISHLSMEMFKVAAKIDATHVPYKGVGPAVPDLISGQAHLMVNSIPELLPYTKGGTLRVIGSMTEQRHPFIPDVPTFTEQGYKEFVMGNWTGIVAPAGTPKPVVNKLATEVTRIIRSPGSAAGIDPCAW